LQPPTNLLSGIPKFPLFLFVIGCRRTLKDTGSMKLIYVCELGQPLLEDKLPNQKSNYPVNSLHYVLPAMPNFIGSFWQCQKTKQIMFEIFNFSVRPPFKTPIFNTKERVFMEAIVQYLYENLSKFDWLYKHSIKMIRLRISILPTISLTVL
jgi:hypothetical protein